MSFTVKNKLENYPHLYFGRERTKPLEEVVNVGGGEFEASPPPRYRDRERALLGG